jgi:hypothetical protein
MGDGAKPLLADGADDENARLPRLDPRISPFLIASARVVRFVRSALS